MRTSPSFIGRNSSTCDDMVLKRRSAIVKVRGEKVTFNFRGTLETGSTGARAGRRMRGQRMGVLAQTVLHQKNIMQRRDDGERECRAQENGAADPDPARGTNGIQHHEKHRGDLRKRIRLAEYAWPEVSQTGNGKQHRAGGQDRNVAAEHQHREFPRNLVQNRKHGKHGAQQQLVGNWVEILPQQRLLMQFARQQSIQAIAQSRGDEQPERPRVSSLYQFDHDERHKDHAQQRQLVRRGQDLRELHSAPSAAAIAALARRPSPAGERNASAASKPVFEVNRCESDGSVPSARSSSMRSMRCMGKKTTAGLKGSPSFTMSTKSSKEASSMPLMLTPSAARLRIFPQNLSRGLPNVTTTIAPCANGFGTELGCERPSFAMQRLSLQQVGFATVAWARTPANSQAAASALPDSTPPFRIDCAAIRL